VGIHYEFASLLASAYKSGVSLGRTLTVGRQVLMCSSAQLRQLASYLQLDNRGTPALTTGGHADLFLI